MLSATRKSPGNVIASEPLGERSNPVVYYGIATSLASLAPRNDNIARSPLGSLEQLLQATQRNHARSQSNAAESIFPRLSYLITSK